MEARIEELSYATGLPEQEQLEEKLPEHERTAVQQFPEQQEQITEEESSGQQRQNDDTPHTQVLKVGCICELFLPSTSPSLALSCACWPLQIPDLLTVDQDRSSHAAALSPALSQSRRTEQSPRVLCTISPSVANSADDTKRDTLGDTVSKRHWNSLREQVKKPPGQSLLERMQWAAAQQAKEAKANSSSSAQATTQAPQSSGQPTAKEAPVRPPRPSGHGSKSRLAANRDRLLQAE